MVTLQITMGMTLGYSGTEGFWGFFFHLDYIKAFDTISLWDSILLEKLAVLGLDGCALGWLKIWLEGWAQSLVGNGLKLSWHCSPAMFPRTQWDESCLISLSTI